MWCVMRVERLVMMANQIAAYFNSQPGGAPENPIADHLRKFWDPRMRREIIAHVERGGAGLDPAALKAVRLLARV